MRFITALEIFANPRDLTIKLSQANVNEKFAIGFFRGPGHRFKPLHTSQPFADTPGEAVDQIGEILRAAYNHGVTTLSPHSDPSEFLSLEFIDQILAELREHHEARTHEMPVVAA